jgi:hypothetical protein
MNGKNQIGIEIWRRTGTKVVTVEIEQNISDISDLKRSRQGTAAFKQLLSGQRIITDRRIIKALSPSTERRKNGPICDAWDNEIRTPQKSKSRQRPGASDLLIRCVQVLHNLFQFLNRERLSPV